MEIFQNPNCKKIRGSHILEVSCAFCKCFIATYQKVGESNFVKMYNDRIINGSIDFSRYLGAIFCPGCGERIATRYITKMDKKKHIGSCLPRLIKRRYEREVCFDEKLCELPERM